MTPDPDRDVLRLLLRAVSELTDLVDQLGSVAGAPYRFRSQVHEARDRISEAEQRLREAERSSPG